MPSADCYKTPVLRLTTALATFRDFLMLRVSLCRSVPCSRDWSRRTGCLGSEDGRVCHARLGAGKRSGSHHSCRYFGRLWAIVIHHIHVLSLRSTKAIYRVIFFLQVDKLFHAQTEGKYDIIHWCDTGLTTTCKNYNSFPLTTNSFRPQCTSSTSWSAH